MLVHAYGKALFIMSLSSFRIFIATQAIEEGNPENWIVRHDFQDLSNFKLYLTSSYFVITCVVTVGYGDIIPVTPTE